MRWDRIADVNLNRLNESLKFLEDIIRFSLESKESLVEIRKIRNDFLKIKKALPLAKIINHRASKSDLGRPAKFDVKTGKTGKDLLMANLSRAKESARILEEIFKSKMLKASSRMKEIRFKIYDLEKSIVVFFEKVFDPRIYAIIDERYLLKYRIEKMISILENNGVTMIQLRVKTLSDRKFYDYAVRIRSVLNRNTKFIINNRLDIALACQSDGVHIGQGDVSIRVARRILGENYIIGVSAHNIKQAAAAERNGCDYLGVGSIFGTKTKVDARICGLSALKKICKKTNIPVIGIGGITNKNYKEVFKAGAAGVAIAAYLFEGDLRNNIRSLTLKK